MNPEKTTAAAGFTHHFDPVMLSAGGVHLWWYGLCFVLGFLTIFLFLRQKRHRLGFSISMVYDLTLFVAIGVLIGGRFIEVAFYEWPFYQDHPHLIAAYWIGGMATHGLLLGGLSGAVLFCRKYRLSFLPVADALALPAAFILGFGRIGNFIDGQIVGSLTDVGWAVKFPDAEGFRHPVVLYDGLKNFLLVPVLLWLGKKRPAAGVVTGVFLFLYASLRIFIDLFREYPTSLLGLATGQILNLLMAASGLFLTAWCRRARDAENAGVDDGRRAAVHTPASRAGLAWRRVAFGAIILFSLLIPSDWTADVPVRYGKRHPGLTHSAFYPKIDMAAQTQGSTHTVIEPNKNRPEGGKTE
jgi:phosphatidylglycerol---prolipoprotein diacylglyceryl transferase